LQPVATCRQSPYLHKPAIIIMTSFALAAPVLIVTSFSSRAYGARSTRSHYDVIRYWAGHPQRYGRTYGHLAAFDIQRCFMFKDYSLSYTLTF